MKPGIVRAMSAARGSLFAVRLARVAVFVLVVLGMAAGSAWASFPGRNGTIVYGLSSGDRYSGSASSIQAVNSRSGRVRLLRNCPLRMDRPAPDCAVSSPHYSPDGRRIAFPMVEFTYPSNQPEQSRPGVGIMASDGTRFESKPTANRYSRLAWSPAGDRFLLERFFRPASGTDPFSMYITSLAGNELSQLMPGSAQGPASPQPDWASTGEIAFVGAATGCTYPCEQNIFVTRVGESPRRLTFRGGDGPSWSPHGSKLAFVRRLSATQSDIYIVRRNGRGLRRFTRRGGFSPTWSPDGKWIAFLRGGDLHVIRINGKRRRRLVRGVSEADGLGLAEAVDWQPLPR